jgi:hypothetical protein
VPKQTVHDREIRKKAGHHSASHVLDPEQKAQEISAHDRKGELANTGGLGTEIAALFRTIGLETEIPEHRGHPVRPADLEC